MEWLTARSDAELVLLRAVLQSGRIHTPLTATRLRAIGLSGDWAEPLGALLEGAWSAGSLAAAIDWVLTERNHAAARRPRVVSTHPGVAEPGFVDTSVVLRRLFQNARSEVLLAGFRVTDRSLLEHLIRRDSERLDVRIFFHIDGEVDPRGWKRKTRGQIDPDAYPVWWWREFLDRVWPEKLDPPRGYYSPLTLTSEDGYRSMHIKTAVIDRRQWLVTSANFTDRALHRNMELGVLIEDERAAERVIHHFEMQAAAGVFVPFSSS
jgi:phosphatidylserine/phosphatidylglycerophosphate/cardiolipin synthase-like enzyme